MAEQAKTDAAEHVKQTEAEIKSTEAAEAEKQPTAEQKKEETISEALGTKPKEPTEPKMIPLSALIDSKKENKALQKQIKDLQTQVESGDSKKETNATVVKLKEKYPDSAEFIDEFYGLLKAEAGAEADERVKPLEERTKAQEESANADRITKVFNQHFDKAIEQMPEFKDVAQRDVIKALALDPANANKKFSEIFELAYGHLIKGKKGMETTKPRGGNKDETGVDFTRAAKDTEYYKEIMADPARKAEYNKGLEKRLRL